MRATFAGVAATALLSLGVAFAATKMGPAEIQAAFFNGQIDEEPPQCLS